MKIAELVNLNDNVRFISLKPRLLKSTALDMETMNTGQWNDVPMKVRHLPLTS
jgi:hypothetical protein